jgi:hypothetical protein
MDSLPHELLVRVCTFLCTASLCRLCGASKALRIALKDDPNAWENALQSTWWYPIDTLKRHDNFTFWCSCYSIRTRLSLNRQIRDRAHIDFQLAVFIRCPKSRRNGWGIHCLAPTLKYPGALLLPRMLMCFHPTGIHCLAPTSKCSGALLLPLVHMCVCSMGIRLLAPTSKCPGGLLEQH